MAVLTSGLRPFSISLHDLHSVHAYSGSCVSLLHEVHQLYIFSRGSCFWPLNTCTPIMAAKQAAGHIYPGLAKQNMARVHHPRAYPPRQIDTLRYHNLTLTGPTPLHLLSVDLGCPWCSIALERRRAHPALTVTSADTINAARPAGFKLQACDEPEAARGRRRWGLDGRVTDSSGPYAA